MKSIKLAQKTVALIPGDGIGKEVVPAAVSVLEKALNGVNSSIKYVNLEAGWETFQATGSSLPQVTLDTLRNECDGALFGAVSSPIQKVQGYTSPIVKMRNELDLYANLRPVVSSVDPAVIRHVRPNVDMLIVRENTECLYVKKERLEESGEKAIAERIITRRASTRIAHMAFQKARERRDQRGSNSNKKTLVTIVHKSNVVSVTDGLFRESCLQVAKEYPDIPYEEQLVDSMAYKMVLHPESYDVVVAPNLYGDILSDLSAAFVGGLGLVPSANVNAQFALCEPVHGSAPDIYGKRISNPIATVRAASMLLRSLADQSDANDMYTQAANRIDVAIARTLSDRANHTPDLGGNSTTDKVTEAIIRNLN